MDPCSESGQDVITHVHFNDLAGRLSYSPGRLARKAGRTTPSGWFQLDSCRTRRSSYGKSNLEAMVISAMPCRYLRGSSGRRENAHVTHASGLVAYDENRCARMVEEVLDLPSIPKGTPEAGTSRDDTYGKGLLGRSYDRPRGSQ